MRVMRDENDEVGEVNGEGDSFFFFCCGGTGFW